MWAAAAAELTMMFASRTPACNSSVQSIAQVHGVNACAIAENKVGRNCGPFSVDKQSQFDGRVRAAFGSSRVVDAVKRKGGRQRFTGLLLKHEEAVLRSKLHAYAAA